MMNLSLTSDSGRKTYHLLHDILTKISYKPGWKIVICEEQSEHAFTVIVAYEGYESKNAAITPVCGRGLEINATKVAARLLGKTFCQPETRYFHRKFYMLDLERMTPDNLIKYVIADTIKQAEMHELERWFKFEGDTVFE